MTRQSKNMHQDWTTITFGSNTTRPATRPARPMADVPRTACGRTAAALQDESDELKHQMVNPDLKQALAQARLAKGLSQKALAQALNLPAQQIATLENGTALPDNKLVACLECHLGVKLPRTRKPPARSGA